MRKGSAQITTSSRRVDHSRTSPASPAPITSRLGAISAEFTGSLITIRIRGIERLPSTTKLCAADGSRNDFNVIPRLAIASFFAVYSNLLVPVMVNDVLARENPMMIHATVSFPRGEIPTTRMIDVRSFSFNNRVEMVVVGLAIALS